MDSNHTIFKSAAKFFSGTLISRLTGYMRDLTMAFCFGTSPTVAAFLTSFRLSNIPRRLLGEGGMQSSFIPHFEELKHHDLPRAKKFFIDLNGWLALILVCLIVISISILGLLLLFFPFSSDAKEILFLTSMMMPGLFFICLYGLNAGLLECEKSYFTPSVAPVGFNIIWIGSALGFSFLPTKSAIFALAISLTFASFAQWAVTIPKVLRIIGKNYWKIDFRSQDVKKLWKPLFLANIGVIATQLNAGLDPLFARYANLEGPAWLWFAIRIEQLPLSLFGIALSGALLPPLSRAAKTSDWGKFHHFLKTAFLKTAFLMIPITIGIFILGGFAVKLLFGYGDFHQESIEGTTRCLFGYGLGLLPQTWVLILAPAFYAAGEYRIPAKGACLAVGVNMLFNSIAIFGLNLGPESVAYATSLASLVNVIYLKVQLRKSSLKWQLNLKTQTLTLGS